MDGIYTMASPSISSLYGNVNAAIREYVISRFPRNYFKYEGLSTEIAFRNIRRKLGGNNSKRKIEKRQKPFISIQPLYQHPDRDQFLQSIPLSENFDDVQYRVDGRYLIDVIADEKYGYKLKYRINRDRIEYEIRISLSTQHQQVDLYHMMRNTIRWDRPFTKRTALEAVIPKTLIHHIGKMCKMDVENEDYMIPILLQRLNACSQYPITYKLRNASATDEYYMYYLHNIVLQFYDLSIDEGTKIGMVDDHYDITFKVSADFNLPGLFVITGNIQKLDNYKVVISAFSATDKPDYESNSDYIPLFTVDNFYSRYPPERNGMRLLGSTRFLCDTTEKEEILNIESIFSQDHAKVIRFYTTYNMNPDVVVNLILLKNNSEMILHEDYCMDWNTFTLTIKNPDKEATYRIVIYIDLNIINHAIEDLHEAKLPDLSKLKENNIHREDKFPSKETPPYIPPEPEIPDEPEVPDEEPKEEEEKPEDQYNPPITKCVEMWCDILNITDIYNARKILKFENTEGVG